MLLWENAPAAFKEELSQRLQNVALLTKERLLADHPRDDVRSALAMFDRRKVNKGFGPLPSSETRKVVLRGVRHLAKPLGREEKASELQYIDVLSYMIKQWAPDQPLAEKTNQEAWALLLDDGVWESACPHRLRAASDARCRVIRFTYRSKMGSAPWSAT